MKVKVDFRKCTKSGECYYNYPELFKVGEDGFPVVQVAELSTENEIAEAQHAAEFCPTEAILTEGNDD